MKHLKIIISISVKTILVLVIVYVIYGFGYGNFHKIDDNAYRSAQLFSFNMPFYLEHYKIKTLINLRGENDDQSWYQNEKRITDEQGVTLIDFGISSGNYLDFNQTAEIVEILRAAEKPLLIHCEGGADRTSLVAALYRYAILQHSADAADDELSFLYGHVPIIRPKVIAMDKSFDNYVEKSKQVRKVK